VPATAPTPSQSAPPGRQNTQLRISTYDQASALLIALLTMIGFVVSLLFLIWMTSQVWIYNVAVPVTIIEEEEPGGGGGTGGAGSNPGDTLEEPATDEVIDTVEAAVETTLDAIADVVITQQTNIDKIAPTPTAGTGNRGDGRRTGPLGDGTGTKDLVPRWERWDIRYSTNSIEMYSRQLDSFAIELGAVGGGSQTIDYAVGFSGNSPKKRVGPATEEKRLYFTWKQGSLMEADNQLLTQAGIKTKGRIMMQFYPKPVENQLAALESAFAGNRDIRGIRRTVFGVRAKGAGFEYYVMDQTYRTFQL
jgi:hypothetical protein